MLLKNIAHLCTNQQCVPNLGNSDLVQFPPITGEQRKAESKQHSNLPSCRNEARPCISEFFPPHHRLVMLNLSAYCKKMGGCMKEEVLRQNPGRSGKSWALRQRPGSDVDGEFKGLLGRGGSPLLMDQRRK